MIGIEAIATTFVGERLTLESILNTQDFTNEETSFFQTLGINTVHVNDDLESYDLAKLAFDKLMTQTGVDPKRIDLIIYIRSRIPLYLVSSEATRLQYESGAKNALAYAVSDMGCADISMALKQASDYLIANNRSQNVIIAYGCKSTVRSRFRFPVTVNGDGGIAVLITRTNKNCLRDFTFRVNGKYWDLFKIDFRNKFIEDYAETCIDQRKYWFDLALESREIFMQLQQEIFLRNDISPSDVHHYIIQNISERAYEYYETAFDITISPVCRENLEKYGHLGSSDVMLNLYEGITSGKFKKNENVLILNNSPSAAWSCILIAI